MSSMLAPLVQLLRFIRQTASLHVPRLRAVKIKVRLRVHGAAAEEGEARSDCYKDQDDKDERGNHALQGKHEQVIDIRDAN